MTTPASTQPKTPAARKLLTGIEVGVVTSAKRDKTRTVAVQWQFKHRKYGKYLNRATHYQVHDEKNQSKLGDRVEIANCRPISKTKSWRLVRIVEVAPVMLEHQTEAPTP